MASILSCQRQRLLDPCHLFPETVQIIYMQTSPSSIQLVAAEVSAEKLGFIGLTNWTSPLLFICSNASKRYSLKNLLHFLFTRTLLFPEQEGVHWFPLFPFIFPWSLYQ